MSQIGRPIPKADIYGTLLSSLCGIMSLVIVIQFWTLSTILINRHLFAFSYGKFGVIATEPFSLTWLQAIPQCIQCRATLFGRLNFICSTKVLRGVNFNSQSSHSAAGMQT